MIVSGMGRGRGAIKIHTLRRGCVCFRLCDTGSENHPRDSVLQPSMGLGGVSGHNYCTGWVGLVDFMLQACAPRMHFSVFLRPHMFMNNTEKCVLASQVCVRNRACKILSFLLVGS